MAMHTDLQDIWKDYLQKKDDDKFKLFLKAFLDGCADVEVVDPNYTSKKDPHETPHLAQLPDDLLSVLGCYLKQCEKKCDASFSIDVLNDTEIILKTLTVISRNFDNIPFVASCDFVSDVLIIASRIIHSGLSSGDSSMSKLFLDVLHTSLYFLECLYDPYFHWRTILSTGYQIDTTSHRYSPAFLHIEVIPFFYGLFCILPDCFQLHPSSIPSDFVSHCLHLFGAILSGAKHNALRASCPATLGVLLLCISENGFHFKCREIALDCLHAFINVLLKSNPDQQQVDLVTVFEEYCQKWRYMCNRINSLDDFEMILKVLEKLQKIIPCSKQMLLQSIMAQVGWIQGILEVIYSAIGKISLEDTLPLFKEKWLCVLLSCIHTISFVIRGNREAKDFLLSISGFENLLLSLQQFTSPTEVILNALMCLTCDDDFKKCPSVYVVHAEAANMLFLWLPLIASPNYQLWLADALCFACSRVFCSRMICCKAGVISTILSILPRVKNSKVTVSLIKTMEKLGSYSIDASELRQLISVLRLDADGNQFPFTSHLMHALSTMAKRDGFEEATTFFDFQDVYDGITVPTITKWNGYSFTFHAWVRLNKVTHSSGAVPMYRRQLYSFCTSVGCGFEAFFLPDGILVIAVLTKKEYLTVPVTDFPINDNNWHSVSISHSSARRPFMQSQLAVYIDGKQRLASQIKCSSMSEPFTHCRIGSGGEKTLSLAKLEATSSTTAERLLSSLPIPSFFSLPLPLRSSSTYDHGVTVLAVGMQDKVWGIPSSLQGQLSSVCVFHDTLQSIHFKCLHVAGPNNLTLFSGEDVGDLIDLANKLVLYYHAKACDDALCVDLSPLRRYHGHLTGRRCETWDVKECINSIGGLQVLFSLVENASTALTTQNMPDVLISPEDSSTSDDGLEDWVILPSSAYSEWKLEQNQAAGFLILLRNFIQNNTGNQEQLLFTNGIATIGALLQKIPASLVNVHLLMAMQLLLESTNGHDGDLNLRHALYHYILFDFRIWCKSEFSVRIGHIQYLSTIIKDDRKYFRKKYGVLYLLDVIRQFYSPHNTNLNAADCRAIRISLLGLVRYFISKDINNREMDVILNFLFSVKEEEMLTEVLEMLLGVMEHRQCKDQVYLLLYEPGCIDLCYCLLLNPMYSIQFRCRVLKLVSVALKTDKVYEKSKIRLRLQDIGLAGLVNRLEGIPVSLDMAKLLVDQVLLTDNVASYQSLLVLTYFIRYTDVGLKLHVARRVAQVLTQNTNAPLLIVLQYGWYDCILQLLVKQPILGQRKDSGSDEIVDKLASSLPSLTPPPSPNKGNVLGSLSHVSGVSNSTEDLVLSPRFKTPQLFRSQMFDFETQSFDNRSLSSSKASSLEDLTNSQSSDTFKLTQDLFESHCTAQVESKLSAEEVPQIKDENLTRKDPVLSELEECNDTEDELCQLIANIVFTVMWKGISGTDIRTWKERGQVFTCINIIALNNYLYKSHLELKRRILEQALHAAVYDLKEAGQAIASYTENAMEVMKWTYDFVVIDSSPDRNKKLSGKLLDGVLGLLDTLLIFEEASDGEEWTEMAQMGMRILLECASSGNLEIFAMATPKLHAIIQTRMMWSKVEEVFFLLDYLDRILAKTVEERNQDHYSFIIPLVKALIENAGPRLNLYKHLPGLPSNNTGPTFFEDFQQYCQSVEWRQFIEKHVIVKPIAQRHLQHTVGSIPDTINEFWNECYESTMIAVHRRNREWGESRLRFQSTIMEVFSNKCIEEQMRYNNLLNQARNQYLLVRRRWRLCKLFLFGVRGPWKSHSSPNFHWKLSHHENLSRMRLKLVLNHHFDLHLEASRLRDNLGAPQPQPDSLPIAVARQARVEKQPEDILNEEDLKALSATELQEVELTGKEKLVFTEECELVVLMSVVKGRLEVTTTHIYFFDSSQIKEDERYDFKWPLSQLREVHLRRYNLRRSALEFFLLDQTNYFLNFSTKTRNKVYSRILGLRPPNLFVFTGASPMEIFKSSGFTQKWLQREISNFDYLVALNTFAGRTYNDLSQYPVFPWIISDYACDSLDLNDPQVYRDLSKPIGVVNPNNISEVKAKYMHFEDPTGIVEKFHYGTHYSNSAGVLHYLVRLEPFTSLHIELQSGRFDVADRQFHSIPGTWKMLMENPNDVKELIPEFFYLPEFLMNMNGFDLGKLQGSKELMGNVVLPKWAKTPEEFIYLHRKALESEYVSSHIHEWIDLIFGFKQKGPAAVEALNVFYYCSYEGAVDLDAITDPVARAAMEGMINNFGQTPCQLFKEPHPTRMPFHDAMDKLSKVDNRGINLLSVPHDLRLFEVELSIPNDPVLFIATSRSDGRMVATLQTTSDVLVTISESGAIGVHTWLPYNKSISNYFSLDIDPTFLNLKMQRKLCCALQPGISVSSNLFAVTHDVKMLYSGGFWDNSIQVFRFAKARWCARLMGHKGIVTSLAVDRLSRHLISGSKDLTCIIWDISQQQVVQGKEVGAKRLQVLYGHREEVTCVAIMTELDLAVSGSKDGTINVHTVREGLYLHTLRPDDESLLSTEISYLVLSDEGHVVASTKSAASSCDTQRISKFSTCVFSINGKRLWLQTHTSAVTALVVSGDHVIYGNTRGQLIINELNNLKVVKTLSLPSPARHLVLTNRNTHLLASLQNSKLMVVGVALPIDVK